MSKHGHKNSAGKWTELMQRILHLSCLFLTLCFEFCLGGGGVWWFCAIRSVLNVSGSLSWSSLTISWVQRERVQPVLRGRVNNMKLLFIQVPQQKQNCIKDVSLKTKTRNHFQFNPFHTPIEGGRITIVSKRAWTSSCPAHNFCSRSLTLDTHTSSDSGTSCITPASRSRSKLKQGFWLSHCIWRRLSWHSRTLQ